MYIDITYSNYSGMLSEYFCQYTMYMKFGIRTVTETSWFTGV